MVNLDNFVGGLPVGVISKGDMSELKKLLKILQITMYLAKKAEIALLHWFVILRCILKINLLR